MCELNQKPAIIASASDSSSSSGDEEDSDGAESDDSTQSAECSSEARTTTSRRHNVDETSVPGQPRPRDESASSRKVRSTHLMLDLCYNHGPNSTKVRESH